MDEFKELPLKEIEWDDPIRDEINSKDVEDMAKSILALGGVIHPIVVERKGENKFNGVVGRLRYEGTVFINRTTIPCRIHSFMDDSERKTWQLIENLVRRNLNPLQQGEGYKKLKEYYQHEAEGKVRDTHIIASIKEQVQKVAGEEAPSERTIYKYIQFAEDIAEEAKKILKTVPRDTFGKRHAEELLQLKDDPEAQVEMANFIRDEKPTSKQLRARIEDYLAVKTRATPEVKQAVEDQKISMRQAAEISGVAIELQEPILDLAEKGVLRLGQTKKVVDYVEENPETAETLKKAPSQVIADALTKKADFEIPCACPQCKTKFMRKLTADWKKEEITYFHEGFYVSKKGT